MPDPTYNAAITPAQKRLQRVVEQRRQKREAASPPMKDITAPPQNGAPVTDLPPSIAFEANRLKAKMTGVTKSEEKAFKARTEGLPNQPSTARGKIGEFLDTKSGAAGAPFKDLARPIDINDPNYAGSPQSFLDAAGIGIPVGNVATSLIKPAARVGLADAGAALKTARTTAAKGLVNIPAKPAQQAGLRLAGAKGVAGGSGLDDLERLSNRYVELESEIEMANSARAGIHRPPWSRGMSNEELIAIAKHEGRNPYKFDWGDSIDPVVLKEARQGRFRNVGSKSVKELKAERDSVLNQIDDINAEMEAESRQVGQIQSGMGIGEKPSQGMLLGETPAGGQKGTLASPEALAGAQARRTAVKQGQKELTPAAAPRATTGAKVTAKPAISQADVPIGQRGWRIIHRPDADTATARGFAALSGDGKSGIHVNLTPTTKAGTWELEITNLKVGDRVGVGDLTSRQIPLEQSEIRDAIRFIARTYDDIKVIEGKRATTGHRPIIQTVNLNRFRSAPISQPAASNATPKAPASAVPPPAAGASGTPPGAKPPKAPKAAKPPPNPPPPRITPEGNAVPPPSFESARRRLVAMMEGAIRRGQKETEALRATERSKRAAIGLSRLRKSLSEGGDPLIAVRSSQKGELPVGELKLQDRLTPDEGVVLRNAIYKTLGDEQYQTAANVDEALRALTQEGKIPTPSELLHMEEIFGSEFTRAMRELRTLPEKLREVAVEIWNFPRTILSIFDDSMGLRQGLHYLPEGAPTVKAWLTHWKAITRAGYEEMEAATRAHPWYNHATAHGVDVTGRRAAGAFGREEPFLGAGLARRIPIVGKAAAISEQLATSYMNKLRIETYGRHAEALKRMKASNAAYDDLANVVNILSGRANLGRAEKAAPILNGLFFSARLNWARAQTPFLLLKQAPNLGTSEGRLLAKMIARNTYGLWAGLSGMVAAGYMGGVWHTEWDRRSSDFLKVQVGNIRIDPWGGMQQFFTLIGRIASGERKSTTTRQVIPADEVDTLTRFIESKLHPALSNLISIKRGENYIGEDLTVKNYAKQWLPIFIQDVSEFANEVPPGIAAPLAYLTLEGMSVYNIPGVPNSLLSQMQDYVDEYNKIPTDTLEVERGQLTRTQYRQRNPEADAALFLAGQTSSLESGAAIQRVAALVREHGLDPDQIRGVAERKERQQKAAQVGQPLEWNEVDALIRLLEGEQSAPAAPTPTPTQQSGGTSQQDTPAFRRLQRLRQPTPEAVGSR